MNCPYCKTKLPDGSQFCSNCGQSVKNTVDNHGSTSSYWASVEKEKSRDEKKRVDAENEILEKQKNKRRTFITVLSVIGIIGLIVYYVTIIHPNQQYNKAFSFMQEGKYTKAVALFESLDDYN